MPIDKRDYPPDWKTISTDVKEAAGWRCEYCCARHLAVIERSSLGSWTEFEKIEETTGDIVYTDKMTWKRLRFHGLTRVILTTAHLDRNSSNNDRINLAALCQRCHLRYDILQHIANRRYGRRHNKEHQQKLEL